MKSFIPRNHIPGRDYSTCIRGSLLTDARITYYIRKGFYGAEAKARLAEAETKPKPKSKAKFDSLAAVLRLLA